MKIVATIFGSFLLLGLIYFILLEISVRKTQNIEKDKFIANIKSGKKSFDESNWMSRFGIQKNDMDRLKKDTVINVSNGKVYIVSDLADTTNLFINFWFTGCNGCVAEMPEIEQFYEKYNNKIKFLLLSNDNLTTARNYIKKNALKMPFYVFKNGSFPADIEIFPTSHLITNNKTTFYYAGIGYFDNADFYKYVDSVLVR